MTVPPPPPFAPPPPARRAKIGRRILGLSAFTLIELLCVITIIAILASLLMPALGSMESRANSIQCASNLRTIGAAVQLYLQDHNQNFPEINLPSVGATVYPSGTALTATGAFGQYGVTQTTLQCPSDLKQGANSSYSQYGTSYDWKPTLDDENTSEPLVYGRRMQFAAATGTTGAIGFVVKLSKVRQCFDDTRIHFGHMNALYADGHVVYFTTSTTSAGH